MWVILADAATNPFLQYGALGALVALLLPFAYGAYRDQRDRANRLENELREQNRVIQDKLVTELARATQAIADVIAERRRRRDRE